MILMQGKNIEISENFLPYTLITILLMIFEDNDDLYFEGSPMVISMVAGLLAETGRVQVDTTLPILHQDLCRFLSYGCLKLESDPIISY